MPESVHAVLTGKFWSRWHLRLSMPLGICLALLLSACSDGSGMNAKGYIKQASAYLGQSMLRESIIASLNALQLDPESAKASELLIEGYLKAGNGGAAEAELLRLPQLLEAEPLRQLMRVEALLLQERFQRAADLMPASEPDEESLKARYLLAQAEVAMGLGQLTLSERYYQKAQGYHHAQHQALLGLMELARRWQNESSLQNTIHRALNRDPRSAALWLWLGEYALEQQKFTDAESAFEKALILDRVNLLTSPKLRALQGLSRAKLALSDPAGALQAQQRFWKRYPNSAPALYWQAFDLITKGRWDGIQLLLRQVSQQLPNDWRSHFWSALALYRQAETRIDAEAHYYRFIELSLKQLPTAGTSPLLERGLHLPDQLLPPRPVLASIEIERLLAEFGVDSLDCDAPQGCDVDALQWRLQQDAAGPQQRLRLATLYLYQGRYEELLDLLDGHAFPLQAARQAKLLIFLSYLQQQQLSAADRWLQSWLKSKPKDPLALNAAAHLAQLHGETKRAAQLLRRAIKQKGSELAKLQLAKFYRQQGRYKSAKRLLQQLFRQRKLSLPVLRQLYVLDRRERAAHVVLVEQSWLRMAQRRGGRPSAFLVLAEQAQRQGDLDQALKLTELYLERFPNELEGLYLKARLDESLNLSPAERVTSLRRLMQSYPYRSADRWLLLYNQLQQEDFSAAEVTASAILKREPESAGLTGLLAQLSIWRGEQITAIQHLQGLERLLPTDNALLEELRGDWYWYQGNFADATQRFELAWKIQPSWSVAVKLFQVRFHADKKLESLAILDQWLRLQPQAYAEALLVAQLRAQLGDLSGAFAELQRLSSQGYRHERLALLMAQIMATQQRPEALAVTGELLSVAQSSVDAMVLRVLLLMRQAEPESALKLVEEAMQREPEHLGLRQLATLLHAKQGLHSDAMERAEALLASKQLLTEMEVLSNLQLSSLK